MSGEQDRDALVALLNQHSANFGSQAWTCRCGKQKPYFGTFGSETHVDHLAEVLADHDRRVRASALREAADDMYAIFMSGHLLGTASDLWLRERADRIEGSR